MSWSWPASFVRTRSLLVPRRSPASVGAVLRRGATLEERLERSPLAMEDYAELVVELCARTDIAPALLARFGIGSEAELARVQGEWAERLAADGSLRSRFLAVRDELVGRKTSHRVLELTFDPANTLAHALDDADG